MGEDRQESGNRAQGFWMPLKPWVGTGTMSRGRGRAGQGEGRVWGPILAQRGAGDPTSVLGQAQSWADFGAHDGSEL